MKRMTIHLAELIAKRPTSPTRVMAVPILKTFVSLKRYIHARMKTSSKPGSSRKNSTMPRSNSLIITTSAR